MGDAGRVEQIARVKEGRKEINQQIKFNGATKK